MSNKNRTSSCGQKARDWRASSKKIGRRNGNSRMRFFCIEKLIRSAKAWQRFSKVAESRLKLLGRLFDMCARSHILRYVNIFDSADKKNAGLGNWTAHKGRVTIKKKPFEINQRSRGQVIVERELFLIAVWPKSRRYNLKSRSNTSCRYEPGMRIPRGIYKSL